MLLKGLLPIGSVVLLKDSTKRVMIIGFVQRAEDTQDVFDYIGCFYPEGYIASDRNFLFNHDQIDKLFALGFQDEEQLHFKEKIDEALERVRKGEPPQL